MGIISAMRLNALYTDTDSFMFCLQSGKHDKDHYPIIPFQTYNNSNIMNVHEYLSNSSGSNIKLVREDVILRMLQYVVP